MEDEVRHEVEGRRGAGRGAEDSVVADREVASAAVDREDRAASVVEDGELHEEEEEGIRLTYSCC